MSAAALGRLPGLRWTLGWAMDRARVWPDFRDAWILFEDADVIAIAKPVGVSSQAADPESPDDIVTRLKRFLAARAPAGSEADPSHAGDAYVGVHQRLDRETSGVLVFARRREANGRLAAQFEGRTVRKTYVACVTGWPALPARRGPGPVDRRSPPGAATGGTPAIGTTELAPLRRPLPATEAG